MAESLRDDFAVNLACEVLYRYLAAALQEPGLSEACLLDDPGSGQLACDAAELLRGLFLDVSIPLGFGELPAEELALTRAVAALGDTVAERRREYIRVFGLATCRECPPYETEYHKAEEVFFRSQQMADVAGFYHAFGLTPGGSSRERPDHLALELEFMALLLMKERQAGTGDAASPEGDEAQICRAARESFLRDHLSWWVPSFALAMRLKAEDGFYAGVGRVLSALMPVERSRAGIAAPIRPLEVSFIESPEECSGCLAASG
jgi:TorA maturation chaperone TorD